MTTSSIINPKQTFGVDAANAHYVRIAVIEPNKMPTRLGL
jgi:hypothetical protein